MSWKLIFLLSLFGLAMAVGTVFVIPSGIEPLFWIAILLVCAVLIARGTPDKRFLHGLCLGLANCVWVTSAHVLLAAEYIPRHPQEVEAAAKFGMPVRMQMLVVGPIIGVVSGVLLGLFALAAGRVLKPKAA